MVCARPYALSARLGLLVVLAALAAIALALPGEASAQTNTGVISGTVTGNGAALGGVLVTAEPADGSIITTGTGDGESDNPRGGGATFVPLADDLRFDITAPDGTYEISGLPNDDYKVRFDAGTAGNWASEYFQNTIVRSNAQTLTIAPETQAFQNVNADLERGATITGTLTREAGGFAEGVCVTPVREGGGLLPAATTTAADGSYSIPRLPAGTYTLEFDPCATGGNLLREWWNNAQTVEAATPIVLTANGSQVADGVLATGGSISGALTSSTGEPVEGARVQVYRADNSALVESRLTIANGTYTVDQLPTGTYHVEFVPPDGHPDRPEFFNDSITIDGANEVGVTAGQDTPGIDVTLTEDNEAPVVSIAPFDPLLLNDSTPSFVFDVNDQNAELTCAVTPGADEPIEADYVPCSSSTGHNVDTPLTPDGTWRLSVLATDGAGNEGSDFIVFELDATPPEVQITGGPSGLTLDTEPTFEFTVGEAGTTLECSISPGADDFGPCTTATSHTPDDLADGTYAFKVKATDAAGNAGNASRTFTVDTTAPVASIDSGPTGPTSQTRPTFGFQSEAGSTALCSFDDNTPNEACSGPGKQHTPATALGEGAHTFYVLVQDAAGNNELLARSFTVDTQAPVVNVDSAPTGTIQDRTPTFGFSASDGVVQCSLVESGTQDSFDECSGTGTHTPASDLADATYTFKVRATDAAGNVNFDTAEFTLDTTGPQLSVTAGPNGPTNDNTPTFSFSAGGDAQAIECAVDEADAVSPAFGSCSAALGHTATTLGDGDYVFRVRAIDGLGNPAGAERSFSVDTQAPAVAVTSGPDGITADPRPTFSFTAEDGATVRCSVSSGAPSFTPCSGAGEHRPPQNLADGSHEFAVRATDAAGNQATATRAFVVDTFVEPPPDTTAPTVKITSGPLGKITDRTPRFGFSSDDPSATFLCSLDGQPEAPCASPLTLKKLKTGKHLFTVVAVDAAGNRSAADSRSFKVAKKKKKKKRRR